ncbi:BA14K family protein [Bartonella sp. CB175]|uniref:BA14K family protein n=1 Tax=Bartonella sp. CB175 TaxID=3112256 RepID=UPI00300E0640
MLILKRLCYAFVIVLVGSVFIIITNITSSAEKSDAESKGFYQSSAQEKKGSLVVTGRRELNGFKGYRTYRLGYLRYSDNWWYPEAAFIKPSYLDDSDAKSVALKTVESPKGRLEAASLDKKESLMLKQHINFCVLHYRSYNKSDNSYQPFHGSRKQCFSHFLKG